MQEKELFEMVLTWFGMLIIGVEVLYEESMSNHGEIFASWQALDKTILSPDFGGFQLLDLIITKLKSHVICYNSKPLVGWNNSIQTGEQIL